ncbi:MAG TPA: hypothetical protein VJZ69_01015 [Clostridia bacterium]|nr:hypothetical protein [Clostridia bacterium]
MFSYILSATLNYADYALIGLCALVFLGCTIRGLGKSLYGFFFSLVIILGSFYLSGLATEPLLKAPVGQEFNKAIDGWADSWGDAFNCEVFFVDSKPVIYPAGSTTAVPLANAVSNKALGLAIEKVAPKVIPPEGGMSLSEILVPNMTYILGYIIVFIAMMILLKIFFKIINSLWDKLTHNGLRHKGLDKFMGAVISVVYSGAFVLFALAIIGMFADKPLLAPAIDMVKSSQLCSWIFVNNPILTIFLQLFVA